MMSKVINKYINEIISLIEIGVELFDVHDELNYRDNAIEGAKWNDNLYKYTTKELEDIEMVWEEYNKTSREVLL